MPTIDAIGLCCSIAKTFYHEVIIPVKQMLRIDEFKGTKGPERSWDNLKSEFKVILDKLEGYGKVQSGGSAKEKLKIKVALNIREAIQNQLHVMNFYKDDSVSSRTKQLMRQAPGTNLGTESEFAHADNDLKRAGDLLAYKLYPISMSSSEILSTQD